jgi:hypothetical protein
VVQIPVVWEEFLDEAIKDFTSAEKKYKGKVAIYEKKLLKWEKEQAEGTSKENWASRGRLTTTRSQFHHHTLNKGCKKKSQ